MATITPVSASSAGVATPFTSAAGGGDTIATAGLTNVKLLVNNGSGSTVTVTLTGSVACSQGSTHNTVIPVAAGFIETITIPAQCINETTKNVAVGYSSATSVTVAAIAG